MKKGGVSLPKSGPVDSIVDYASLVSSLKTLFLFALLLCSCFFFLLLLFFFPELLCTCFTVKSLHSDIGVDKCPLFGYHLFAEN